MEQTEKSSTLEKTEIPKHKNALAEKYEKQNKAEHKKEEKDELKDYSEGVQRRITKLTKISAELRQIGRASCRERV